MTDEQKERGLEGARAGLPLTKIAWLMGVSVSSLRPDTEYGALLRRVLAEAALERYRELTAASWVDRFERAYPEEDAGSAKLDALLETHARPD